MSWRAYTALNYGHITVILSHLIRIRRVLCIDYLLRCRLERHALWITDAFPTCLCGWNVAFYVSAVVVSLSKWNTNAHMYMCHLRRKCNFRANNNVGVEHNLRSTVCVSLRRRRSTEFEKTQILFSRNASIFSPR